jgi:hypothetical protein
LRDRLRESSYAFAAVLGAVLLSTACGPGEPVPVLDLPERAGDAPGGDEISREIRTLELRAREERIYAEISQGNVPTWLRQLRPVEVRGEVDGHRHRITFWVTPDYLAVGSESDYLLIPLSAQTAQRIADLVGGSLPTPRMVDAIWASADLRLDPIRLMPDDSMKTVRYFERHDNLLKGQRHLHDVPLGALIAGDKLDVVITSALSEHPGAIALYGWHSSSGEVIQPLFIGATDSLVTFSHGVRLVDRSVVVDGARRDLWDVLRDPELAQILSDNGVIAQPHYLAPGGTEGQ